MNLVEHYILEIFSEEEIEKDGKKYIISWVKVDCYGRIDILKHIDLKGNWEKAKEQGFFLV